MFFWSLPDTEAYAVYPQTSFPLYFHKFARPTVNQSQKIILVETDWEDIWSKESHEKLLVTETMSLLILDPQDPEHSSQLKRNVDR